MVQWAHEGNYTCYQANHIGGLPLGGFQEGFCAQNCSLTEETLKNMTYHLFDSYWLCGNGRLRSRLPPLWKGQCTLVKLILPFKILPWDPREDEDEETHTRRKREAPKSKIERYEDDPEVYIDAIGVPRGVPNKYKAQDQIAAGFASIIPQVQINKNVDWINYIYYNEQRFVNYSRDAFTGVVEELGPNTRMTLQNRMAVDMILAEKGGVCGMIGEDCCTYIPQNSAVDGKTTLALKKITGLAAELKKNSGIEQSWADWFIDWTGGWSKFFKQIVTMLLGMIMLSLLLLCCGVPVYKSLLKKITDSKTGAFTNQEKDDDVGTPEDDLPMVKPVVIPPKSPTTEDLV